DTLLATIGPAAGGITTTGSGVRETIDPGLKRASSGGRRVHRASKRGHDRTGSDPLHDSRKYHAARILPGSREVLCLSAQSRAARNRSVDTGLAGPESVPAAAVSTHQIPFRPRLRARLFGFAP